MRRLPLVLLLVVTSCRPPGTGLEFGATTPEDVRVLVTETFDDFRQAFPARAGCAAGAVLEVDRDLEDRGHYDPQTATITLRIPETATKLRNSFLHELAHHLEFACESQEEVRPSFLAAQGFPPHQDWFGGPSWRETPSEHFAEAVVEVVEGRRNLRYGIGLSREALDLVEAWGEE
jgi:hypothetical protein